MNHFKAKILVVDDDPNLLDLLMDTLNTIGYRAEGVSNGVEALSRIKKEQFQMVISDIKMPEMDGVQLLKKIRELVPSMPVLFISGYAEPELIGRASPDGFLAKPFRINLLEELIEKTLIGKPERILSGITNILVVDDNKHFREMMTEVLRHHNYEVEAVASAEDALASLQINTYDTVITDVKMPGMDGITLTGLIKEKYPDLPVIVVTAYLDFDEAVEEMHEVKADGLLKKPFQLESIISLLQDLSPSSVSK